MPVIEVGKLSEPLSKFVDVVAQGIGGVYRPLGTVLQAHADAKASIILAEADIQKQELLRRAAARLGHIEVERQKNIEVIVEKAKLALPEEVSSKPVEKEWINHFFDACQDVSDSDLQDLWAKILVQEIKEPDKTPKRVLEFLKTIEKIEAEIFESLIAVSFEDEGGWNFIIECDATQTALFQMRPGLAILGHLIDIGLLASEPTCWGAYRIINKKCCFENKNYKFTGPPKPHVPPGGLEPLEYWVSTRYFTSIGQCLARVVAKKSAAPAKFVNHVSEELKKQCEVAIETFTS